MNHYNYIKLSGGHDFTTTYHPKTGIDDAFEDYSCKLCFITVHVYSDDIVAIFLKNEKASPHYPFDIIENLPSCNELMIKNLLE